MFKSGDKSLCNNYRPISILSHIAKVFERLVHVRLSSFLEKNNIVSNFQLGFRPAHSTQHAINYSHEKFLQALDNNEHVAAVFLDSSKAFDIVNHEILLCKLQKYGVHGMTSDFFHSYLSNRCHCQFTKFGETESSRLNTTCGVPQGSILDPLLFLLYINDLPQASAFQPVLFADDTCLFSKSNCMRTVQAAVNGKIKHVNDWLISNKLTLNCSKTKFVVLTRSHELQKIKINVVARTVEEVNQVKIDLFQREPSKRNVENIQCNMQRP